MANSCDDVEKRRSDLKNDKHDSFYTHCFVNGKVCSLRVDEDSGTNAVSPIVVNKLGLTCTKHLHSYKLQLPHECGEVEVSKQVLISFTIGRYTDDVI